ncbi:MAG: TIGR02757 family protein [Synergistaceae bacterium]|jgi:uncharacterized protein (TIGR02757 family)|nr:TIGR02757 family protein [Synergistaceae bacterium]
MRDADVKRMLVPEALEPYRGRAYELLEDIYADYNRREYVSPDPLEFLYLYDSPADREIVGLIASSLAYGRVASILASVRKVLSVLGESPADTLASADISSLTDRLLGFRHRFTGGAEMASFLFGIGRAVRAYGTLERAFCRGMESERREEDDSRLGVIRAMDAFAASILSGGGLGSSHLLPRASKGSACKRLALYIRWMVRRDDVDPGGWSGISPCDIIVPLDTHMFHIASGLGFTARSSADGKTAMEITGAFARLCPDDPVRYDFALTRFGIRAGMSVDDLLAKFAQA